MASPSQAGSFPSERLFRVGLTGGIGSGKSAVADLFAGCGAAVVDSDAIAHALTRPGGAALAALAESFGPGCIGPDGGLDRARMRELAFRDPGTKARLEALLHPVIREQAAAEAQRAIGVAPYVVFVVPLLVESGRWRQQADRLLVIDCAPSTQEARVVLRSGLERGLIRRIIAQQASRAARLDAADDVLVNEGPRDLLASRVRRLHRRYCDCASARR